MIDAGLQARLTCIDPRKLDRSFAGRSFDQQLLDDLPAGIDPCGENGEFHSFAFDGPMFHSSDSPPAWRCCRSRWIHFCRFLLAAPDA